MKTKILASIFAIVCVLVIVAVSWMPSTSAETEGTETIDEDYYWYYVAEFFSGDYLELIYTIDVQNDQYIDVMLLNTENFNKYVNDETFEYYTIGTDFNTLYTDVLSITFTTYDNYYIVVDNTDSPPNGAEPAWDGVNNYCTFHYLISATTYTYSSDTDGDGVDDEDDAFPNDPYESKDSDGDGVGDNGDYYPYDPTRWELEADDSQVIEENLDALCIMGYVGVVCVVVIVVIVLGLLYYKAKKKKLASDLVYRMSQQPQQQQPQQPQQQPPQQQPYYRDESPPGSQPPQKP